MNASTGCLGRTAHEVGKGLDVIRFLRIQLGREAPREDPWITISGTLFVALAIPASPVRRS
jgi:hypothetical protein